MQRFLNVTERKHAEDALRRSQLFVQKILDTTPTLIYIYDLMERRNSYANREIVDFLGYTIEHVKAIGLKLVFKIVAS